MKRIPRWRVALHETINGYRQVRFRWGVYDCSTLSADSVLAMTGFDPMANYRGKYNTREEAEEVLRERGFLSHVDAVAALIPETVVAALRVGDIAAVAAGNELGEGMSLALGVVIGPTIAVMSPNGLSSVPLDTALRAFQVG